MSRRRGGMKSGSILLALLLILLCGSAAATETIRVVDDSGQTVELPAPARRIVSLAPHVTELLFAAGAGARIVGTVEFSDHPPAARAIPRIGSSAGVDFERVIALRPDLVIAWASGSPKPIVDRLRRLNLKVYLDEPRRLEDIARSVRQIGRLAGTQDAAEQAAETFLARYRRLAARYADRARVRVFYQVLDPLLITVNGEHLISEGLRLCGGENVFDDLPVLAPAVSEEAVLRADPEAIVAGGIEEAWKRWHAHWQARTELTAVRRQALYFISADLLHRHSPRVLDGVEQLCEALEDARRRR